MHTLKAAEKALTGLRHRIWLWSQEPAIEGQAARYASQIEEYQRRFWEAVESDLDLPSALSLTWEMVRSDLPGRAKMDLLLEFDEIFGLDLDKASSENSVTEDITTTLKIRGGHRDQSDYATADSIRGQLASDGYLVEDTADGTRARPTTPLDLRQAQWPSVSSSRVGESCM